MSRSVRLIVIVAAFLAQSPLIGADAPNGQVQKLAKERVEIETQIHELTRKAYEQGSASFSELQESLASLLTARLEVCTTKQERVMVLEEMVKLAEQTKDATERLVRAGEAPQYTALKAKSHLLEVRIRLEKEKATQ